MTSIAELAEDRTVEGVYAVARKERRRTRNGASYLALELVDPSGRIEARVWNDVELLDRRFDEGDAVKVLGRVERFGGALQLQVRAPTVMHEITIQQLQRWLDGAPVSPNEAVRKARLKSILR